MAKPPRTEPPTSRTTVREARRRFFAANQFGPDGGYDAPWQSAEFGPLRYRVPNPPARARALRLHDLHHLVTGYAADWRGEAQISAWELGSGWGRQPYAWVIALFGLLTGLFGLPRSVFAAFARGRRSHNLYRRRFDDALLDRDVDALREELSVPPVGETVPTLADALGFAGTSAVALAFGAIALPFVAALVGLGELEGVCDGCSLRSSLGQG